MRIPVKISLTYILWMLSLFCLQAQTNDSIVVSTDSLQQVKPEEKPTKTKVYLEHANTLSFDKEMNADAQILTGDVCFRHDSAYM